MTYRKKLIEVALPLDAINKEATREKSIRLGHPSTFHLWWARRPLAACRAVLFASLIDDPSEHPEEFPTEQDQERERDRLFRLIEAMVKWENSNNKEVLEFSHLTIASINLKSLSRRSEEHTSELQSPDHLVCRLLLEKTKKIRIPLQDPVAFRQTRLPTSSYRELRLLVPDQLTRSILRAISHNMIYYSSASSCFAIVF